MQHGVAKNMEKLMREFPWEGMLEGKRDYLVIWDVVSQVKEKGGWRLGQFGEGK